MANTAFTRRGYVELTAKAAYVISPTEKRGCVEHFAAVQQQAVSVAEDEPYTGLPDPEWQRKQLWAYLCGACSKKANVFVMASFLFCHIC